MFEKFTKKSSRSSIFVSLTSSKSFGFGGDFLKENQLEDKTYVELFFDASKSKIAFKFTEGSKDENAFKLIATQLTNSKSIVARSYFATYLKDFDLKEYQLHYQPEKIHDPEYGTLFVIKLKKKIS